MPPQLSPQCSPSSDLFPHPSSDEGRRGGRGLRKALGTTAPGHRSIHPGVPGVTVPVYGAAQQCPCPRAQSLLRMLGTAGSALLLGLSAGIVQLEDHLSCAPFCRCSSRDPTSCLHAKPLCSPNMLCSQQWGSKVGLRAWEGDETYRAVGHGCATRTWVTKQWDLLQRT